MNAKPLKLLLLEDGCKDARFLQKTIGHGGSFECELVKLDELEKVLPAVNEEPPIILLRSGDSSARLSANLKRIREIAASTPVLVLPSSQYGLVLPPAAAGESAKSDGHLRLNPRKLARFLRRGMRQHQMESELSHLAISDELTGLYNRRGFLLLGSERMSMAHGMKKNVLLFFADLDNLKQINDQFGHQEGDQALLKTAEIFRNTFRDSDITGRFGGDEFTALVIEEFGQTADTITRRLQENMAELAANNTQYPLSLSVGMTRYAADMRSSLKKLLAQADQALYKQKRATRAKPGGNPTVMFPGSRQGFAQYGFRAPGISVAQRLPGKVRKSSTGAL
ncbi:MAG TPA: GGDEF domain-containing protein [Candidatus Acidoferrales bacterium]|nr:GGDEF domain-containing protein [Candidatus Acidoferrales bacterium]